MPDPQRAVVDTNVLITANGQGQQVPTSCTEACIDVLLEVQTAQRLAVDQDGEILAEYAVYCSYSGQPGVGDQFFLWAHQSQYTACHRVPLTPHEDRVYKEFPATSELAKFDRSDRKFVATALGCNPVAEILNATDSDYCHCASALEAAGVEVTELCVECLKPSVRGLRRGVETTVGPNVVRQSEYLLETVTRPTAYGVPLVHNGVGKYGCPCRGAGRR